MTAAIAINNMTGERQPVEDEVMIDGIGGISGEKSRISTDTILLKEGNLFCFFLPKCDSNGPINRPVPKFRK